MYLLRCLIVFTLLVFLSFFADSESLAFELVVQKLDVADFPNDIWFVKRDSFAFVVAEVVFKNAGYIYDPVGKSGLSNIVSDMLLRGSGNDNYREFSNKLDVLGASISIVPSRENLRIRLRVLQENLPDAMMLLSQAILHPAFEKGEMALVKNESIARINARYVDAESLAHYQMNRLVFSDKVYTRSMLGELNDVAKIDSSDLFKYASSHFSKKNLEIVVVGNSNSEAVRAAIRNAFTLLPVGSDVHRFGSEHYKVPKPEFNVISSKRFYLGVPQSTLCFARAGIGYKNKDYFAALVATQALGGMPLASKLSKKLRGDFGLTYRIYMTLDAGLFAGNLGEMFGCAFVGPDKVESAKDEIGAVIDGARYSGITNQELDYAKNTLISNQLIAFAGLSSTADYLCSVKVRGYGPDYVKTFAEKVFGISLRSVNYALRNILGDWEKYYIVEVGKNKPVGSSN